MICAGFGHRAAAINQSQAKRLDEVVADLIKKGFTTFYAGDRGQFDSEFASAVLKHKTANVNMYLILSYYNNSPEKSNNYKKPEYFNEYVYNGSIYPPLEEVPKKWAISYRNRWMVEQADFLIFCINRSSGGAYAAYKYAKHLQKPYINIGLCTDED